VAVLTLISTDPEAVVKRLAGTGGAGFKLRLRAAA
jgi:hypothetical protein